MHIKPPYLARLFFPQLLWEIDTDSKEIFLTFDDGPHPEITPRVLEILDGYNAKATFFCVGENVKKYPKTYASILKNGHQTGNHSFSHLNGWKTSNKDYFDNIKQCSQLIDSRLFRPPYGRISPSQIKSLKHQYKIVMWSAVTYDFDKSVTPSQCLENALKYPKAGSIVVFHDSAKASTNLFYALPRFLQNYTEKGFAFNVIPDSGSVNSSHQK